MRVHTTSQGLDPRALRPGRDLVLDLAAAHGTDVADLVLAHDHVGVDVRWELWHLAVAATADCIEHFARPLTADGIRLAWIWELDIHRALSTTLCQAEGLRRAVERFAVETIVLVDPLERTRRVAAAVAAVTGVAVAQERGARATVAPGPPASPGSVADRARRRMLRAVRERGLPSRLRPGSVVLMSYWPLMPLVDRMLAERRWRPAVMLAHPPSGSRRWVRAALRGGWIGAPGPADRRRGEAGARAVLAAAQPTAPPALEARGLDLGEAAHGEVLAIARARATGDLAHAAMLRRALRRGRPAAVLASRDADPAGRLLVHLAREAGIRTLALTHGTYLLPQAPVDLEVCDEPLLWSPTTSPPITNRDRPIHLVGYPMPHGPPPPTRAAPRVPGARILVLGQGPLQGLTLNEPRVTMRQYAVAVSAVRERLPGATIVLRPHPAEGLEAVTRFVARHPELPLEVDADTPILAALAGADLCIATITAVTLQAALVGTPVVALNLLGFAWSAPLGGDSRVPVARDERELVGWLDRWATGPPLAGRDELLEGLGASPAGAGGTDRILDVLASRPPGRFPSGPRRGSIAL